MGRIFKITILLGIIARIYVSALDYRQFGILSDGVALAWTTDENVVVIDEQGKVIVLLSDLGLGIHSWGYFVEGFLPVVKDSADYRDKKVGFINIKGELTVVPQYDSARRFSDGMAAVQIVGDKSAWIGNRIVKWGYVRENGELVIPTVYNVVKDFYEGRAFVNNDRGWLLIDQTGKLVVDEVFRFVSDGFSEGLAAVCGDDLGWGYINRDGNWEIPPDFTGASYFSEGLAAVRFENGVWGFIDREGTIVFDAVAKSIPRGEMLAFKDGWAIIPELDEHRPGYAIYKYGYLSVDGRRIPSIYDRGQRFSNGIARVIIDGREGAIDEIGNWVIPPGTYDELTDFYDGIAAFRLNRKYGAVDRHGNWIIQPEYEMLTAFVNGTARARKDGKLGYINIKGEWLF
jgi:hypothetical protein